MSTDHLYVVKLKATSGLARDNVINTWPITSTGDQTGDFTDICDLLAAFYNDDPGSGDDIASFISPAISRNTDVCEINVFDLDGHLDGSAHGSPLLTYLWTLDAAGASQKSLPAEVSVVLSYLAGDWSTVPEEGASSSTIPTPQSAQNMGAPATHTGTLKPRARKRGRIYLGPLNAKALPAYATTDAYVNQDLIDAITGSYEDLAAALPLLTSIPRLGVWSRRNAEIDPIATAVGATIGFVDNAFDTQRRRGTAASGRQLIVAP